MNDSQKNFAAFNGTQIYYEVAGSGPPFVMIHAGVADNRQWNNEFAYFAQNYTVLLCDLRGHGQTEPVEGEFSHMADLIGLLDRWRAGNAYQAGDWDLLAEIDTQIWFDGENRRPEDVNQEMRQLDYDMDRTVIDFERQELGKRLPDAETPAADQLSALSVPVLVIVGEHDTAYIRAAADVMVEQIPSVERVVIADAAHLPNMDHPETFRRVVETFLNTKF